MPFQSKVISLCRCVSHGHISSDKTNKMISTPDSVFKDRLPLPKSAECYTHKTENHRITEHPEMERSHKNHQNPTLDPAQGSPKNHTMCLGVFPKYFLNSWRIYNKDTNKKNLLIAIQKVRFLCERVLQHWKKDLKQNYKLDQFQKVEHKSLSCL